MSRANRNKKLTQQEKLRNKIASKIRYIIERFLGIGKLHYGARVDNFYGEHIKRGINLQHEINQTQES